MYTALSEFYESKQVLLYSGDDNWKGKLFLENSMCACCETHSGSKAACDMRWCVTIIIVQCQTVFGRGFGRVKFIGGTIKVIKTRVNNFLGVIFFGHQTGARLVDCL